MSEELLPGDICSIGQYTNRIECEKYDTSARNRVSVDSLSSEALYCAAFTVESC